jgi:hypothetical protein
MIAKKLIIPSEPLLREGRRLKRWMVGRRCLIYDSKEANNTF